MTLFGHLTTICHLIKIYLNYFSIEQMMVMVETPVRYREREQHLPRGRTARLGHALARIMAAEEMEASSSST